MKRKIDINAFFTEKTLAQETILGKVFVEKETFQIAEVKKAWGKSPVILTEVIVKSTANEEVPCIMTSKWSAATGEWRITISSKKWDDLYGEEAQKFKTV